VVILGAMNAISADTFGKNKMQGKRIADGEWPENQGEYSKHKTDQGIIWFCRPPHPGISIGSLSAHTVVEHEDGTITVSPSIFFNMDHPDHPRWHGYLEHGIWREC